jgi:hypothetical protein
LLPVDRSAVADFAGGVYVLSNGIALHTLVVRNPSVRADILPRDAGAPASPSAGRAGSPQRVSPYPNFDFTGAATFIRALAMISVLPFRLDYWQEVSREHP